MTIRQLKRKRHIVYRDELNQEVPGEPVFEGSGYEAFKLRIRRRDTDDKLGEINFLIREKSNNLRHLLLYCFVPEPDSVCAISFWINDKVLLPSGELAHAGPLLDDEKGAYYAMDFAERFLKKKYAFVSENLQQF